MSNVEVAIDVLGEEVGKGGDRCLYTSGWVLLYKEQDRKVTRVTIKSDEQIVLAQSCIAGSRGEAEAYGLEAGGWVAKDWFGWREQNKSGNDEMTSTDHPPTQSHGRSLEV